MLFAKPSVDDILKIKNSSVLSEDARKKLLEQQNEAFKQHEIEKQKLEESKKKKPLEGSKYLSLEQFTYSITTANILTTSKLKSGLKD